MFADDTNLFYSHNDIKTLFKTVNNELKNIHEWFKANKLSINADKNKIRILPTRPAYQITYPYNFQRYISTRIK